MSLLKVNEIQSLGGGSVSVDVLNSIKSVNSFSELSTAAGTTDYLILLTGYHSNTTIGGGLFKYNSARSTENDYGTIVNGWERISNDKGPLTFQMFGARCDGTTDDTTAFVRACNSAIAQNKELLLSGNVLLALGASVANIPSIIGVGNSAQITVGIGTLTLSGVAGNISNSKITNIKFNATSSTTALEIIEQSGLSIIDCTFDTAAIGILLHNKNSNNKTENISISNTKFTNNCACAITYRKTSGNANFINSGLKNCTILTPNTGTIKSIKIDAGCNIVNCPLSITYTCDSSGSASIIYSDELTNKHSFYGTLQIYVNSGTLSIGTSSYSNLIEYSGNIISDSSTAFSANHFVLYSSYKAKQDGGYKNKLLNGNFDHWQRGTTLSSAAGQRRYLADRWVTQSVGSSVSISQQSFSPGQTEVPWNPNKYHRCVVSSVSAAGNYVNVSQHIEGVEVLSNGRATCSFWAKADGVKRIAVELVQNFGTGGSPSTAITGIGSTYVTLSTAWQRFTVTAFVPSIFGKVLGTDAPNNSSLQLIFWLDAGTTFSARTANMGQQSGTFDIAQVQLESGPVASEFEQKQYQLELTMCMRYYQKIISGYSMNFASAQTYIPNTTHFITKLRKPPTWTVEFFDGSFAVTEYSVTVYKSTPPGGTYSPGIVTLDSEF